MAPTESRAKTQVDDRTIELGVIGVVGVGVGWGEVGGEGGVGGGGRIGGRGLEGGDGEGGGHVGGGFGEGGEQGLVEEAAGVRAVFRVEPVAASSEA